MNILKKLKNRAVACTLISALLLIILAHQLFSHNFASYLQSSAYISLILATISNSNYFKKDNRKLKIGQGIDAIAIFSYAITLSSMISSCIAFFHPSELIPSPSLPVFALNLLLTVTLTGLLFGDAAHAMDEHKAEEIKRKAKEVEHKEKVLERASKRADLYNKLKGLLENNNNQHNNQRNNIIIEDIKEVAKKNPEYITK